MREITMGERNWWDEYFPDNVIPTRAGDHEIEVRLLDKTPIDRVTVDRAAIKEKGPWESIEAFRAEVDWE